MANVVDEKHTVTSSRKFFNPQSWSRVAILMVGTLFASALLFSGQSIHADDAFADDFPTWNEVEKARKDEKAAKAKATEIRSMIAAMEQALEPLRIAAEKAGQEYAVAIREYDAAVAEHDELKETIAVAEEQAKKSAKQAGILASQMGRSGGGDLTMNLLMNGDDADDLLYRLGTMSQLSNQTAKVFELANSDKNSVKLLADQASVVESKTEDLKDIAEEKLKKAQDAQRAHEQKLASQQETRVMLEAQIITLTQDREKAEDGYRAYLKKKAEEEAERKRKEEEERKRIEEELNKPKPGKPGGGGVSNSGWTRPALYGYITSNYGNRGCVGKYCGFHTGTDLGGLNPGGGSCNGKIVAAGGGRVIYAGYFDSMSGNQVMIDHGNGIVTWYAHMYTISVRNGQIVLPGQLLGGAGDTGAAYGCHLHFEFRINGKHYNPATMLAQRGVRI